MAVHFSCNSCGEDIYIRYLRPGEISQCPNCKAMNTIPGDSEPVEHIPFHFRKMEKLARETLNSDEVRARLAQTDFEDIRNPVPWTIAAYASITLVLLVTATSIVMQLRLMGMVFFSDPPFTYFDISAYMGNFTITLPLSRSLTFTFSADIPTMLIFVSITAWMYIMHKNLRRANLPAIKLKSYWAIVGIIIPLLHFVMPYYVMRETWKGSRILKGKIAPENVYEKHSSNRIKLWWAFLFIFLVTGAVSNLFISIDSTQKLIVYLGTSILSQASLAVFLILLLLIIREISNDQIDARNRLKPEKEDARPDNTDEISDINKPALDG